MSIESDSVRPLGLVTGASTGIGLALLSEFVEAGLDVLAVADEEIPDTAGSSPTARAVRPVTADLATATGNEDVIAALESDPRPVVAAALNAGVGVNGRFDQTDIADQLRLLAVNVESPVRLAHYLTGVMTAQRYGRILITSSVVSQGPGPNQSTYAASKAFLHSFAEAIRYELRDTGVTVTSLQPGPTDTAFFARAGMQRTWVARGPKADPSQVAREGFAAMMAGKDRVVPGSWLLKAQSKASKLVPEALTARFHASLAKPRDPS
ncbi:SDR family NAD(P)-dependent oxidoreductase [Mumia sp. Pv 4-285]|uniref:SDR family NAD(P)-dependent oxidoreductase n=1 Tax=Mumia qirimensis TaxID=3234852 RepID=UPI00351D5BBC